MNHYTKEGDCVLDPMAGTGSSGVLAAFHGRDAVLVELEQRFHEWIGGVVCDGYSCHFLGCYQRRELEERVYKLKSELRGWNRSYIEPKIVWREPTVPDEDKTSPVALRIWGKFVELEKKEKTLAGLPLKPHVERGCLERLQAVGKTDIQPCSMPLSINILFTFFLSISFLHILWKTIQELAYLCKEKFSATG